MALTDLITRDKPTVNMDLSIEINNIEANGSHAVIKKYGFVAIAAATACVYAVGVMWVSETVASRRSNNRTLNQSHRTATENSAIARVLDPPVQEYSWPSPLSPYEQLWPGYPLPLWAQKAVKYKVPASDRMCFVHVGKAGGSAVGCSLGFSLHCPYEDQEDGVLPKITTSIFHKDVYDCAIDDARFLFVVRDPIERARSAFNYDRPKWDYDDDVVVEMNERYSAFYDDCEFGTIEDMVQNGLSDHGDSSENCTSIAYEAIRGLDSNSPSHFYYNYQYYYEGVPTNSSIFALRSEHLTKDWNSLEEGLSGRINIMKEDSIPQINTNTNIDEDDLYISDESREILCEALCNEIQVYKTIIRRAENLKEAQVQESLDALELKCPVQAIAEECPEEMPDIRTKLEDNRGYGPEETTI